MDMRIRYHIIPNKTGAGIMIFDADTGHVQYPICWQDLCAYYHYLVDRGHTEEAQRLLAESMAGNKPITRMIVTLRLYQ